MAYERAVSAVRSPGNAGRVFGPDGKGTLRFGYGVVACGATVADGVDRADVGVADGERVGASDAGPVPPMQPASATMATRARSARLCTTGARSAAGKAHRRHR
jgi:hypothetical protein